MKRVVAVEPGVADYEEYEDRSVKENEVKIRVKYASPKHGTELSAFRGKSPFLRETYDTEWKMFLPLKKEEIKGFEKFALGNMVVGEVVEKGEEVTAVEIGDHVCTYGPISQTVIVNAVGNKRLRKMPMGASWKSAVCYDPAQFALNGVRDGDVRAGDAVIVFGLGAIGQIAIQLANNAGASLVVGVDPYQNRRQTAAKNGADMCFDPSVEDVAREVRKMTNKRGADVIIETSGSSSALQEALRAVAYRGTISYVAFTQPFPAGLMLGKEAHFNAPRIIFSRAASEPLVDFPRWNRERLEDTCWQLLMDGYINGEDIIDPIVPFEEAAEGYMRYVDQEPQYSVKLGVSFE